jgi:hypothetical protein
VDPLAVGAIVLSVVGGLVATLWRGFEKRLEEYQRRTDEEIKRLRDRLHELEQWRGAHITAQNIRDMYRGIS